MPQGGKLFPPPPKQNVCRPPASVIGFLIGFSLTKCEIGRPGADKKGEGVCGGAEQPPPSRIQRVSPNPAIAFWFDCCIGTSVCMCVSICFVVQGVVVCCSCLMFLGPLSGSLFFSIVFVFVAKQLPKRSPDLHGEPLEQKMRPG